MKQLPQVLLCHKGQCSVFHELTRLRTLGGSLITGLSGLPRHDAVKNVRGRKLEPPVKALLYDHEDLSSNHRTVVNNPRMVVHTCNLSVMIGGKDRKIPGLIA